MSVLKYLFPVPKDDSKRMMMFVNHTDWILFRHYVEEKGEGGKTIGVIEVGPQFTMQCKLYKINKTFDLISYF